MKSLLGSILSFILFGFNSIGMKNHIAVLFLVCSSSVLFCQPGQLDETFNATGKVITHIENFNIHTNEVLIQQDGKIVVCGTGTTASNARDFVIARYTADGILDSSFNQSGFLVIDFFGKNDDCRDMTLQSDGKILLTGIATTLTSKRKAGIVRLLNDGSFDESFGTNGIVINPEDNKTEKPGAVIYQEDGSIIVTGSVEPNLGDPICAIFKYNEDGTPDVAFGENGLSTAIVPEGYNPSFGILQEDGKIVTGGFLLGNTTESIILRFSPDGVLDSSYGTNGIALIKYFNEDHFAYSVALQADRKLLVVVGITHGGKRDFCVLRYKENGMVDDSFGDNGRVITPLSAGSNTAHAVGVQNDQKILLAGFLSTTPNHNFAIARYTSTGDLDSSFGIGGKVISDFGEDDLSFSMAIQPDNKIVLAGHIIDDSGNSDFIVARYLSGLEIVGTAELSEEILHIEVYPNPAQSEMQIQFDSKQTLPLILSMVNTLGETILKLPETVYVVGTTQVSLDVSSLNSGVYFLRLQSGERYLTRKVAVIR